MRIFSINQCLKCDIKLIQCIIPPRLHQRPEPSSAGCRISPSCSVQTSTGENWWSRIPSTAPVTGPLRRTPPRQTTLSSAGWPPSTPPPTWWCQTQTAASATTRTSSHTTTSSTVEPGTPSLAVSHLFQWWKPPGSNLKNVTTCGQASSTNTRAYLLI